MWQEWVGHPGDPGRLCDLAVGLGVVYFALLLIFLPVKKKKEQNFITNLTACEHTVIIMMLLPW